MPSNVHIFQKIEAIYDIRNIFLVNINNFVLLKNKNMLRTFWTSKGLLNKNIKPQIKFRRSYKKKGVSYHKIPVLILYQVWAPDLVIFSLADIIINHLDLIVTRAPSLAKLERKSVSFIF